MELENKEVSVICQDFCNSIIEKSMGEFESLFPITFYVGKLVKLTEALRSDINEEKEMPIALVHQLMNNCGFYSLHNQLLVELESIHMINNKGKTIIFNPEKQRDVLEMLGDYWKVKIKNTLTKEFEETLIKLLIILDKSFLYGEEKDKLLSNIQDMSKRRILIKLLEQLELIKYLDKHDIYYSPSTFGKSMKKAEEKILTILKDSKIKDHRTVLESIKDNPGIPYSQLIKHKDTVKILIQSGMIDPIEVNIGANKIPFLWSPQEKEDDALFWAKKAASHFKFGQYFPHPSRGRLNDPPLFISRLLSRGCAGGATSIGTDYNPLVLNRIVKIEKTGLSSKYMMYPVKKDILTRVESLLECGKVIELQQLTLNDFFERLKNPNQARFNPELKSLKEKEEQDTFKNILKMLKNE